MEGDDASVAGISPHIVIHLIGSEETGVVACDEVPHHHSIFLTESKVLRLSHPSVRRTEETGVDEVVGLDYILQIFVMRMSESAYVIEGMIAQTMSVRTDKFEQFGVLPHIVAYHEEGSLDTIAVESINQPRSGLGDRTIIEGQIDCLLRGIHPPYRAGIKPAQPLAWLFDYHTLLQLNAEVMTAAHEGSVEVLENTLETVGLSLVLGTHIIVVLRYTCKDRDMLVAVGISCCES